MEVTGDYHTPVAKLLYVSVVSKLAHGYGNNHLRRVKTDRNVNRLFSSPACADRSEKWADFAVELWHCKCVHECSESDRSLRGHRCPSQRFRRCDRQTKSMSKVGASSLRRTLFLIMSVYLQSSPPDEPVYQFMDRKRAEGKPYRVYMMASANKLLRIYYATVKACLESSEHI